MIFLIPYLCTMMVNGMETALINRKFDMEMVLPGVVASQISKEYEVETVKAQAVIARSNFYRRMNGLESVREMLQEVKVKLHPTYYGFYFPASVYETAVSETEGKVLTWHSRLKLVPYHEISAGSTRDGAEVLRDTDYEYLKAVDSSGDRDAEEYLSSVYVEERRMPRELTILKRDGAGYVTELSADGNVLEGEAFRQGMGLASSNFSIHKTGDRMRFFCRGKGHGLGFSQYGGNLLAKGGNSFRGILEVYFPEMEIMDIGSVYVSD